VNYGVVGKLESIIDLQVNPLIQIMNGTKEVLIPLMDGVVTELDRKKKTMTIQAPAGLIELYIG